MSDLSTPTPMAEADAVQRGIEALLRPRSVAIFGVSSRPGTPGRIILSRLHRENFDGDIFLVGRSAGQVGSLPILTDPTELPEGIDLAILAVPAAVVRDTVAACVERRILSAVSFASGFAETGEDGRRRQEELGTLAAEGGLTLLGPNTVGYFNFVDGLTVLMIEHEPPPPLPPDSGPAAAVIAQSGGMANHIMRSLQARLVPISYVVPSGNEAVVNVGDLSRYFLEDDRTAVIAAYAEEITAPEAFLGLGDIARQKQKHIVLLHPGRTIKGQQAASSHTGSIAGNYAALEIALQDAGVLLVETQEELVDLCQLLLCNPETRDGGLGLITSSGALCALSADYLDSLGLDTPALDAPQIEALTELLPDYLSARNPLDLGTDPALRPDLVGKGAEQILAAPGIGSVLVSMPRDEPETCMAWLRSFVEARRSRPAPAIMVFGAEDAPLPEQLLSYAAENGVVIMRSHERAIRTLATYHRWAKRLGRERDEGQAKKFDGLPALGSGPLAEWSAKRLLSAIGIAIPAGELARSAEEAVSIAERVGYPVVMKAQAASLVHKSDVGGVLLSLQDAAAVHDGWEQLEQKIATALPDLTLDGALVERMSPPGLELVVGAKRDPKWGAVVMVGLGGVWVELLKDVRLLSPWTPVNDIPRELDQLRAAQLLHGFRGAPPVDIDAVAAVVHAVGRLMLTEPDILEIDINPLLAFSERNGTVALDALIVSK